MKDEVQVLRLHQQGKDLLRREVAKEFSLSVVLDGEEMATLLCSPGDLLELVLGYLSSEGLLGSLTEVRAFLVDEPRGVAWVWLRNGKKKPPLRRVVPSGCGGGASMGMAFEDEGIEPLQSDIRVEASALMGLSKEFQRRSELYRSTHGVHSAALSDGEKIILFKEDIGRHNALDKVFGACMVHDISPKNRIVFTTGRVSSEVLFKVARRGVPVVVSLSSPTHLAVELARRFKVTLIGSAKGRRMEVYSESWRVRTERR